MNKVKKEAILLRKSGESIKFIAKKLSISPSSVSLWCRNILLSSKQKKILEQRRIVAGAIGRMKGAATQKKKKLSLMSHYREIAQKEILEIDNRNFFFLGLGLYGGEGFKYGSRAGFSNSNPKIIQFIMKWFRKICNVPESSFSCQVGVNEIYKDRVKIFEEYWSKITGISLENFTKTSIKKVKNKKKFENSKNYYGTLAIRIRKSVDIQYRILGWLDVVWNKNI